MKQIEPNEDTEKLVIRLLVSRGLWIKAWEQVIQRYSTVQAIPMPIFLELLAPGSRIHQKPSPHDRVDEHENNLSPSVRSPVTQEAYKLILHRFKEFPPDSLDKVSLRVLSYVIRSFLKSGHELEAIALTENYIKILPKTISPKKVAHLQALINTHLSTGEIKLTTFKKRRRLVERLFSLHSQLSPNSDTLFLLMRYMVRSKQCGTTAYMLYKAYLGKWGSNMDTLEVRGRIIKYAIKEGKHAIARKMSLVSNTLLSKPKEKDSIATESLELRPWRTAYPKDGRSRSDFKAVVYKRLRVAKTANKIRCILEKEVCDSQKCL
ncbi:hypothetical protein Clacol_007452 [Clathrus columnatus]|uniref:Uncharacterized protein n=1 Tax=Clathrus columnatus TaxID=1419009 RepID=A0AAV5AEY0_9AGAM|nr:hypothetical protein Clacol_007452 [Clathrus columnatus]